MSRLLIAAGEALYGPRWQSDLARAVGVSDRSVRRWVAGTAPIPPGLFADLARLARERRETLKDLALKLAAAAPR